MNLTPEGKRKYDEYRKQYANTHRAQINAYKRKWAKEHPDKVRAATERYWNKRGAADPDQDAPADDKTGIS